MKKEFEKLGYDPEKLERELTPYYISATESEINEMLGAIGAKDLNDLYSHIPAHSRFEKAPFVTERLEYTELINHVEALAKKNKIKTSFLGDGLQQYKVPQITPFVCSIRGLTTAYTPYQPERSQGTLHTLWLYASSISMLTGFEAINASFYDRSTCLYEAFNTAMRLVKNSSIALVSEGIFPNDIEVVKTHAEHTPMTIVTVPLKNGRTDMDALNKLIEEHAGKVAAVAFPQVNNLGVLEDVNALTDFCNEQNIKSIALIDPMLLATEGLLQPAKYGSKEQGADMIVGEGQHLGLGPNFGGPGLGIFGIRFNENDKISIRSTAGRYVGRAKDSQGRECLAMILSTREQHIRREKATSNICSNQSFLATVVGAAILERGETGMTKAMQKGRLNALRALEHMICHKGINLSYELPFFNEFTVTVDTDADELIKKADAAGIQLGINVSARAGLKNAIKISFSDLQEEADLEKLKTFISANFEHIKDEANIIDVPYELKRKDAVDLPNFEYSELQKFYLELGELNVSPDDNIYPLGSCTMKYNPYINDYAASLPGFTDLHPQSKDEDSQGSLEVLYEIQEMFKNITGLAGVVTQPVAGAQGELVGLKMFQGYHKDRGNEKIKDIILIPRSAHGTNPATATMAGYDTKTVGGVKYGIITIEANDHGQINFPQLEEVVKEFGNRIAGIMVTNPNTSGIFESQFKEMADLIHSVDGLVYMDGANMNAIAGWVDLGAMGVDAVHNNLHKTWTIPHGGGGPGDAIVAVSEKLLPFIPGMQVIKENGVFKSVKAPKSIGSFHRHHGNFAHKVRAYTYIKALGTDGVRQMSAVAVLAAKYLYEKLKDLYPTLPERSEDVPRMHEFILTISADTFKRIAEGGTPKAQAIAKIGKLFLDFGLHAPTVAFPEVYGLMIEPTESFSKKELDEFTEVVKAIHHIVNESPEVLTTAPHFTPISKVDEVDANKNVMITEKITKLPTLPKNVVSPKELVKLPTSEVYKKIIEAHKQA